MQILPAYPPETRSTTQREGEQDESAQKEKSGLKGTFAENGAPQRLGGAAAVVFLWAHRICIQ